MRRFFCILVALVLANGGTAVAGVIPYDPGRHVNVAAPVEPAQSAALFVGVREFPYDETLANVEYAVDDAVDLAYVLALERTPHLIEPQRVMLALSGDPQKPQSRRNLEALKAAGAIERPATQSDVLTLLEQQSRTVGPNGILIVAFATHGITHEGTQYLLTRSCSIARRP